MFCKQCGKEIPENSNFCIYCGASQAAAEPAGETVIEPVPQAEEPAAQPELVVEPGPAPEAPPAPELVFDLPVPEAAPRPQGAGAGTHAPARPGAGACPHASARPGG